MMAVSAAWKDVAREKWSSAIYPPSSPPRLKTALLLIGVTTRHATSRSLASKRAKHVSCVRTRHGGRWVACPARLGVVNEGVPSKIAMQIEKQVWGDSVPPRCLAGQSSYLHCFGGCVVQGRRFMIS